MCLGSHNLVFYWYSCRWILADLLKVETVFNPTNSSFIGHTYLPYAGTGWADGIINSSCVLYGFQIRSHTDIVPSDHLLLEVTS